MSCQNVCPPRQVNDKRRSGVRGWWPELAPGRMDVGGGWPLLARLLSHSFPKQPTPGGKRGGGGWRWAGPENPDPSCGWIGKDRQKMSGACHIQELRLHLVCLRPQTYSCTRLFEVYFQSSQGLYICFVLCLKPRPPSLPRPHHQKKKQKLFLTQ